MYPNSSFNCTLPTGAAWDRTLGWLVNTKDKTLEQIITNSSGLGNYLDNSFEISTSARYYSSGNNYTAVNGSYTKPANNVTNIIGVRLTTGAAPTRNVSNNIFDLAGNYREWTTESRESNGYMVNRGGAFNESAGSAGDRGFINATSDGDSSVGFRPVIFL